MRTRMCIVCGKEIDMDGEYGCVWGRDETGALYVAGFAHIACGDNCEDIKDVTSEVTDAVPDLPHGHGPRSE